MPSLRSLLLFGLPLLSVAYAQPDDERVPDASVVAEWEETLKALPADSLEAALEHSLKPKYQGGVFEDGHSALAAVHSDDPELASKLVDLARQDADVKDYLRRRQNSNSTASNTRTSTTSEHLGTPGSTTTTTTTQILDSTPSEEGSQSVPVSSMSPTTPSSKSAGATNSGPTETTPTGSSQTGVLVPVGVTSTASDGSIVMSTSIAFQQSAPTSMNVEVTSTNNQGSLVITTSKAPAVVVSFTNAQGSVATTAVPVTSATVAPGGSIVGGDATMVTSTDSSGGQIVLTSPTPGGVYTVPDSGGNVVTVTYYPAGGTVSQLELQTTVLPNGMQTVITSYVQVGGAVPTSGADGAGGSQSTGSPGLQSGAAAPSSWYAAEVAVVVGAAIGVAGLVL